MHKLVHLQLCYQSWLERRGIVQTFDDADPLKLEQDIIEIRELLNEQDEHKESSEYSAQ